MNVAKTSLCIVLLLAVALLPAACSRTPHLQPLAADAVILAFGDSLTAGTGAGEAESYPAVLALLTGRAVVNAGVPGELSADGVKRLPELLERHRPALLILCHGGNDLLARRDHRLIADNLRGMLRIAGERGVPVLLVAVPSLGFTLEPPPLYEELAGEFAVPVEKKALPHILGKSALKSDYIHPNAAGYQLLAGSLAALLKKGGALPAP